MIVESRLRRKGSRLSLERLERKMKSLNQKPFKEKLEENTGSEETAKSPLQQTGSQDSGRSKLNSMDSSDSIGSRGMHKRNGNVHMPNVGTQPAKDDGLAESMDHQPDGGNNTRSEGIVNMAYEPLSEEAEHSAAQLPLDPSKLPTDQKSESDAKMFSNKDGSSGQVSFGSKDAGKGASVYKYENDGQV